MNPLAGRIEWCRRLRRAAGTRAEAEAWRAEEIGLVDAYLDIDRTDLMKWCHPFQLQRYLLGLRDGQALWRLCRQPKHQTESFSSDLIHSL